MIEYMIKVKVADHSRRR